MNITVKITLTPEARASAETTMIKRGLLVANDFEGPVFVDVQDCQIEDGFVHVQLKDALYAYPVNTVARIAQYKESN